MKIISYSIFNDCHPTEMNFYLRGLYWNARMNKLLYPEWRTFITAEKNIWHENRHYFDGLAQGFNVLYALHERAPRCEAMLWRLSRIFDPSVDVTLCRDADSITTYKESQIINYWLSHSAAKACGINDNPAHKGTKLMGGLCGFKKGAFKESSLAEFIKGYDLSKHGSDQLLLNMKYRGEIFMNEGFVNTSNNPLWESNLIPAFMGSPGINEMEALRFFRRHDSNNYDQFEQQFSNLFYWWL